VLRLVALEVRQTIEDPGLAARYGGEEFAIILPDTMLSQAQSIAEAIRCAVMAKELVKRSTGAQLGRVTVSIGVATLHPQEGMQALIERADACLYAAKHKGRNCVVAENELGNSAPEKQVSVA
jgi:diguanylate cyclase